MSFYGKVYVAESEENIDEFVKSIGLPEHQANNVLQYKPSLKLEKSGDNYIFTVYTNDGEKIYNFKSGEEFPSTFRKLSVKITMNVDGNKMTQVVKYEDGFKMTIKREYTDKIMTEEVSHPGWSGSARRIYKSK